jgi:hypothetical protein
MSERAGSGYLNPVRRLSQEQTDFMQFHDATGFTRSASAFRDAIFVYREELLGSWRWLIDTDANVMEENFFASAAPARALGDRALTA